MIIFQVEITSKGVIYQGNQLKTTYLMGVVNQRLTVLRFWNVSFCYTFSFW